MITFSYLFWFKANLIHFNLWFILIRKPRNSLFKVPHSTLKTENTYFPNWVTFESENSPTFSSILELFLASFLLFRLLKNRSRQPLRNGGESGLAVIVFFSNLLNYIQVGNQLMYMKFLSLVVLVTVSN